MGLTPAGETMLHYVERVHGDLRLMQLELNEHGSGATGHIRLQAITSALTNHLTPDLASFMGLYPRVDFDIEERVGGSIVLESRGSLTGTLQGSGRGHRRGRYRRPGPGDLRLSPRATGGDRRCGSPPGRA